MFGLSSVFAQNLVEHGSLDTVGSNLQRSSDNFTSWVHSISPTTWVIVGIVLLAFFVWSRR